MSDNRRSSFRHSVEVFAELTVAGGSTEQLRLGNLSLGGCFILGVKATMGKRCKVGFAIPTQEERVESEATVRWVTDEGIGIQFDGLRARDVWALNKYFELLDK